MLTVAGLGIASGGLGVGYKALTMPEFDYTKPVKADENHFPSVTSESSTLNRGTLIITQNERVGNTYLDYIENTYKKFEPFSPYSYVVIDHFIDVSKMVDKDGIIKLSKDSLMGSERTKDLSYAFSKSIAMGVLDRGDYRQIKAYADLMEYTDRLSNGYYHNPKKKAFKVLNPNGEVPETPEDIFASVSTSLYLNTRGVKEQIKAMPKEMQQDFNYGAGSMFEIDSEELMISKDLLRHTLNVYDKLLPRDMGNGTRGRLLDDLFEGVGILRYELL